MSSQKTQPRRLQRVQKATESNPYLDYTELKEIAEDAEKYHALKVMMQSDGGQVLIESLVQDIVMGLNQLESYSSLSRDEMVSIIARISSSRHLIQALQNADENLKDADEALEDALRT